MNNWKEIYKKGIVQSLPSRQVIELVPLFKNEGIEKILDHGCGTGRHAKYLAEQGFYVVGTDYSEDALEEVKKLTSGLDNIELVHVNMDSIPYNNGYFDASISSHTIQHALKEQRDGAFQEIERTLKSKGLLFLRTISREHKIYGKGKEIEQHTFIDIPEFPDGKSPHHYFSEEELRDYLKRFEIIKLEHHSSPPEPNGFWKYGIEEWVLLARKI